MGTQSCECDNDGQIRADVLLFQMCTVLGNWYVEYLMYVQMRMMDQDMKKTNRHNIEKK